MSFHSLSSFDINSDHEFNSMLRQVLYGLNAQKIRTQLPVSIDIRPIAIVDTLLAPLITWVHRHVPAQSFTTDMLKNEGRRNHAWKA